MEDWQIQLLRKALELYEFTIRQRNDNDATESNEFFKMRESLSEIIGVDVT